MTHSPQPPHDPVDEREWTLQERALQAERFGLGPEDDAKLQRYRAVTRALREPLDLQLPDDFAIQMALRVKRRSASDRQPELWLSSVLLGALCAMMVGLAVMCGPEWLQLGQAAVKSYQLTNPWLLALVACMVLPAVLGKLTPHHNPPHHHGLR
ncbi:hypothetical protein [Dyella caseinilytica]|uniref:Uncharacterized protein n=1 Tax=Dyella caseinilytica TaxID=1849581 RepID=A0ABX7GVT7_9GAMM|nr:hypothetical protein [Dyella caseinilytica]QRN54578.1 hypothetical protein ISN74_04235 [Dyella caseinilytica]GFZ95367.1 hypothetical protein GCM10011408_14290 [Dyella caseinilytica]